MAFLFFLPMILFFAFFALLIIGFLALVLKLAKKGKDSFWTGVLMDKQHNVKDVDDDGIHKKEHYYSLIFKTDDDKRIAVGVAPQIYNQWQVGDRAEKKKGEFWPKKI